MNKPVIFTDPLARRLAEGLPCLQLKRFPYPDQLPESGWVRMRGGDWSGQGWLDRAGGLLHVLADGDEDPLVNLASRLEAARKRREDLGWHRDEVVRWINGPGDGCSGFTFDRYGSWGLLQLESWDLVPLAESLRDLFASWDLEGIVLKIRLKGQQAKGRVPQQVWLGERPPEHVTVLENGRPFDVRVMGTLNTGLFHDLRTLRQSWAAGCDGKGLLNLFSYTGAFSIAAALSGTRLVTSVDASAGIQDWAKRNVRLSNLDPEKIPFRWETRDVLEAIKRFAKKEEVFERVILDPPAQSRSGTGRFFLKSDLGKLIARMLDVTAPRGRILVTDNSRQGTPKKLLDHLKTASQLSGRALSDIVLHDPEIDFPVHPTWPQGRGVLAVTAQAAPAD